MRATWNPSITSKQSGTDGLKGRPQPAPRRRHGRRLGADLLKNQQQTFHPGYESIQGIISMIHRLYIHLGLLQFIW